SLQVVHQIHAVADKRSTAQIGVTRKEIERVAQRNIDLSSRTNDMLGYVGVRIEKIKLRVKGLAEAEVVQKHAVIIDQGYLDRTRANLVRRIEVREYLCAGIGVAGNGDLHDVIRASRQIVESILSICVRSGRCNGYVVGIYRLLAVNILQQDGGTLLIAL